MINHIRSYFVNRLIDRTLPGSELQDDAFQPVTQLPWYLVAVRNVLFGPNPDFHMLNYRAAQLVRIWHTTELSPLVTHRDSRITYNPLANAYSSLQMFQPQVTVSGSGTVGLTGMDSEPDWRGRLQSQWSFTLGSATQITIAYPGGNVWEVDVEDSSVRHFAIPGTGFKATLTNFEVGDTATIRLLSRPVVSASQLVERISNLSEEVLAQLFGIDTPRYDMYELVAARDVWLRQPEPLLRLGAAAMALAIATEEVR